MSGWGNKTDGMGILDYIAKAGREVFGKHADLSDSEMVEMVLEKLLMSVKKDLYGSD